MQKKLIMNKSGLLENETIEKCRQQLGISELSELMKWDLTKYVWYQSINFDRRIKKICNLNQLKN